MVPLFTDGTLIHRALPVPNSVLRYSNGLMLPAEDDLAGLVRLDTLVDGNLARSVLSQLLERRSLVPYDKPNEVRRAEDDLCHAVAVDQERRVWCL